MRHLLLSLSFFQLLSFSALAQHQEITPEINESDAPIWIQLLYSENPNPDEVRAAYDLYYHNHEFVKNGHTQYYKHWLRNLSRDVNGHWSGAQSFKTAKLEDRKYLKRSATHRTMRGPSSAWECVGPIDYDQAAAERSYAPGAAHVYTVEKAPSNANILYAGTATGGIFKSIDNGLNWISVTRDLQVNGNRALEIDPNDANIVFFESGGSIYKTIDGGVNWSVIGDATFQASSHSANDIVAFPASSTTYFLCANDGLYHTTDAGANWTLLMGGTFQELEFHPTNSNQVYTIRQVGDNTEFYKSIDGGLNWTLKVNGWPGITSASTTSFSGIDLAGATTDYVSFTDDPEPGNPALQDFSIELKVKTTGWNSDPAILSNKNWSSGANRGFVIAGRTNESGWKFNIGDGSNRIDINGGDINDGFWHHLVVTYDYDGTKTLYQDGEVVGTSTTNISDDVINLSNHLALGQDGSFAYAAGIDMEVSDIRIWNTVLDAMTIENWYCQTINNTHPNYSNLKHHWKCEETSGTSLADAIGGNTGTINGSSTWISNQNMFCTSLSLASGEAQKRTEIAVTADEPDYIYALATGNVNGGSGLFGIYKSLDGGESWTFNCCGPQPGGPAVAGTNINTMGWQDDGSDDGGQYYYDLALSVSPTDADKIHVGGVNQWISTDGGTSFTCPSKWSHPYKPEYVHADIHDIRYFGNELWIACDGGIFYSTDGGTNISRRMVGIEGTDFWGFGAGFSDGEVLVGGTYHNGTLLKDNSVYINDWLSTRGGDNYRGFVNFSDNSIVYDDGGKRKLSGDRSQDFTEYGFSMKPNATYVVGESSSIEFDPHNPNISYTGVETAIWKTEDDGQNFTQIYDFGTGNSLGEIRVTQADVNRIYACTFGSNDRVWKSTNGGTVFTEITPPGGTGVPYSISVSATDAQTLWAARTISWTWQGTLNGNKVYKSTDGGANWTNISGTALDGEYLTNILHQNGTDGGIYVGTRRAVYYKNESMSDFVLFNNQLPVSTNSTRLVANYGAGKLYNGTNRSVYKVDFYETSNPIAQIAVEDFSVGCTNEPIQFYSNSVALTGATYAWSFPDGTPATSTDKNPIVTYSSSGSHQVSLSVTDDNGTDSQTLNNFVTVNNDCNPETVPGKALSLAGGSSDYATIAAPNFATNTYTIAAWIKRDGDQNDWAGIVFSRPTSGASGLNFGTNNELRYHWEGASSYNWNSGHTVPDGEWTHVALVVSPTEATIYMNGIAAVNTLAHTVHTFSSTIYVGADATSSSRRFTGLMDEVCVFDRALSQSEIRELRHLTQTNSDVNFKHYYQFNEDSGEAYNRVGGGLHLELQGAASRSTSTAPVGGGEVFTLDCSTSGTKDFTNTDLSITFPTTGTYPNGDLVVSRVDLSPDQLPSAFPTSPSYWIINNYGNNTVFSELENIVFENIGDVPAGSTAAQYKLYKRTSNADGSTWGVFIDEGDVMVSGTSGEITFSANNSISSFSQFVITKGTALPIELLQFSAQLTNEKTVNLQWTTTSEIDNDYFVVERSQDGIDFNFLAKIESKGNANFTQEYRLNDYSPLKGTSYYRLKQVDVDRLFSYAAIQSITIEQLSEQIVVYPNPIGLNQLLTIESHLTEDLMIQFFDAAGKKLKTEKIKNGNGLLSLSGLSTGIIFYQIKGNKFLKNGAFVIE